MTRAEQASKSRVIRKQEKISTTILGHVGFL